MSLPRTIAVPADAKGQRLDTFIAAFFAAAQVVSQAASPPTQLEGISRSRVQLLLDQGDVLVNGGRRRRR